MKYSILSWTNIIFLLLFLSGCSSINKQPDKGVSIFNNKTTTTTEGQKKPTILTKQPLNKGFIRTQGTELQNRFPFIPNPSINLFVYPHLSKDGHPIPGYTTIFNLFEKNHYALPNEIY